MLKGLGIRETEEMPLLETLTLQVAPTIAKTVLKIWLKDSKSISEASSSLVDIFNSITTDVVAQQRGRRQFEEISEKIVQNLIPIFHYRTHFCL